MTEEIIGLWHPTLVVETIDYESLYTKIDDATAEVFEKLFDCPASHSMVVVDAYTEVSWKTRMWCICSSYCYCQFRNGLNYVSSKTIETTPAIFALSYAEDKPVLNLFIPMQHDLNCHQLTSTLKKENFKLTIVSRIIMIVMPNKLTCKLTLVLL